MDLPIDEKNAIQQNLEKLKERLEREISSLSQQDVQARQSGSASTESSDAQAHDEEMHDRIGAEVHILEDELADVAIALGRIDDGSFGVCVKCGHSIDISRLHAMPTAQYCISCEKEKNTA